MNNALGSTFSDNAHRNINEGILPKKIDTVHWFAFGESDESYLIIYTDTDGNDQLSECSIPNPQPRIC